MTPVTPLDAWIARKADAPTAAGGLDRSRLQDFQRRALHDTLAHARARSPYYAETIPTALADESDLDILLRQIPFMNADVLRSQGERLRCVSAGDIERVVTLRTSGSTASPKRLFFTAEDLARTVDFFAVGMSQMVEPGDVVCCLMPGQTPGSVGELLGRAMSRLDATCFAYGLLDDPQRAATAILDQGADVLVAIPGQALTLARAAGEALRGRLRAVLLSGEDAPPWLVDDIEARLECEVYRHYGMTETGLGGGVECCVHHGLHVREADLLFEIVNPATGEPLPPGDAGEIVFTTLGRRGIPLIRYRTGDQGRLLTGPCGCGGYSSRLDVTDGRYMEASPFSQHDLEKAVFSAPEVRACAMSLHFSNNLWMLRIVLSGAGSPSLERRVRDAVNATLESTSAAVEIRWTTTAECLALAGPKRRIAIHASTKADAPCPSTPC